MASATIGQKRGFAVMDAENLSHSNNWHASSDLDNIHLSRSKRLVKRDISPQTQTESKDDTYASFSSARPTPTPSHTPLRTSRSFEGDVSIVLVGNRGTGKSTLAVIASAACHRRVIDVDDTFQEATGLSVAAYRKQHGAVRHNHRLEEVLGTVLSTHDKDCIIVCSAGSMERSGQVLLREYARTHPVIHIVRDIKSIHNYLKVWDEPKLQSLLAISGPIFRGCSNYEFYNLSETNSNCRQSHSTEDSSVQPEFVSVPSFLTLKRAERHFLRFLTQITNQGVTPSLEPAYPLSGVSTELRYFTYAIQAPLSKLTSGEVDIEGLEAGCDAFEIVVDDLDISTDSNSSNPPSFNIQSLATERANLISRTVARVRRNTIVPLIFHVPPIPRSKETANAGMYLDHVRHGLRLAPEFTTIDLSLDDEIILPILGMKGSTKIIGHFHATVDVLFDWRHESWISKYEKARRLGCDAVRLTRPALCAEDNIAVHLFREKVKNLSGPSLPLICFNTGQLGRTSSCFNPTLTSVTQETLLDDCDSVNRSLISACDASKALFASFSLDPMKFYIIGASSGYSLSPAMHNAAYKAYGMPHNYQTHQTPSLNSLRSLVENPHFGGTAITLPFKIEVISLTHSISRHARAIGAVNTLIPVRHLNDDGSIPEDLELFRERNRAGPVKALYGENTDWIGIRACIRKGLSPANAVKSTSSGLIIGAGGMARAATYAMLQLGVRNIVIFNRTKANAEKLVTHFRRLVSSPSSPALPQSEDRQHPDIKFRILHSWDESWPEDLQNPTMILSCIPTHPIGNNAAPHFTLPAQWMKSATGGVVIELAYRTLSTPLMKQVRSKYHQRWACLDGLDLLPEQGFAQFELFTGRRAPRRLMREEVLRCWTDEQGQSDPGMIQSRLRRIDEQET